MGKTSRIVQMIVCLPLLTYRLLLSPVIGPCCRYSPSCSQYALDAIKHYGVFKGLCLSCYRVLRCNPWGKGGYDPVNDNKENS